MKIAIFILTFLGLLGNSFLASSAQPKSHTFRLGENQFWLDNKPFQIISGEIPPSRIPVRFSHFYP